MKLKHISIAAAVLLLLFGALFASGRRESVVAEPPPNLADSQPDVDTAVIFEDSSFISIAEDGFSAAWSAETAPGDPLFIAFWSRDAVSGGTASLFLGEKQIAKSSFFPAGEKLFSAGIYSAGIYSAGLPLSTWAAPGQYLLRLTINSAAGEERSFEYGIEVSPKEFISETIPLNSVNTAIRTDTSDERMNQIERLNAILFAVNPEGVWHIENHALPVTSTRRTSFFGDRRIFAYSNGTSSASLHYGVDFGIPTGTPVYASAHGRVMMAEFRISTGWTVVIEHFPGLYSLYYHLDSLAVYEGQIVSRQAVLGESGATGLATGPHLHWEVRLNGEAVNPDFLVQHPIVPAIK